MEKEIMLSDLIGEREDGSATWPISSENEMIHVMSDYRGFPAKTSKAEVIQMLGGDKTLDEIAEIMREKLKSRNGCEPLVHAIITGCRARIIVSEERAKDLLGQVLSACLNVANGDEETLMFPKIMKITDEEIQALTWQLNRISTIPYYPEVDCFLRMLKLGRGNGVALFPLRNTPKNRERYKDSGSLDELDRVFHLSVKNSKFLPVD